MHMLSVIIITFNEENHIGRCIRSVRKIADEIIILDSYSTDNTVQIARDLGATVYFEKFRGYIGQKNLATQLASHNYILSLDADEALDENLVQSILQAKQKFASRLYTMNRCSIFNGKLIRHGLWYPDRKIRLFDRRIAKWGGMNPHDKIVAPNEIKCEHLYGDILHYSHNSIDDMVDQNNKLSTIAASSLYAAGKRSSWFKILVHPAWAFFNGYFLKLGLLDGLDGFIISINNAHQVFTKYSKLSRLQKNKDSLKTPSLVLPINREIKPLVSEA